MGVAECTHRPEAAEVASLGSVHNAEDQDGYAYDDEGSHYQRHHIQQVLHAHVHARTHAHTHTHTHTIKNKLEH